MVISVPQGDLSRVKSQEPNTDWPHSVELRVGWLVRGKMIYRTEEITASEFFGAGGAPIAGDRVMATIERMRRQGAPKKADSSHKPRYGSLQKS